MPEIGDVKWVRKYAWLPTKVSGYWIWIWLEKYNVRYEYNLAHDNKCDVFDTPYCRWIEIDRGLI